MQNLLATLAPICHHRRLSRALLKFALSLYLRARARASIFVLHYVGAFLLFAQNFYVLAKLIALLFFPLSPFAFLSIAARVC